MVMVFTLVIMMIVSMFFMSMLVMVVMLMLMGVLVLLMIMMVLMHMLIFFNAKCDNTCVGAFDAAFDGLLEVICDIGDSQ